MLSNDPTYQATWESTKQLPLVMRADYIAVRQLPIPSTMTVSGLQMPNDEKHHNLGIVLSAGSKCELAKKGMLVCFSDHATAYKAWHNGEKVAVMGETQLFGAYDGDTDIDPETFGKE